MQMDKERVLPIIRAALKEDIAKGDITTSVLIDPLASAKATIVAREDCVVCGLKIAEWLMAQVDYSVRFKPNCKEGAYIGKGKDVIFLEGHTAAILRAERTMLNMLACLSGIATRTKEFVDKIAPYGVKVMDTRKTLPLLRYLEKYAVFTGGGANHRMGLYDQVLIKDNHIKGTGYPTSPFGLRRAGRVPDFALRASSGRQGTGLKELVEKARKKSLKGTVVEIEVSGIKEFQDALEGKPDIIMLDNMSPEDVKACVEIRRMAKTKPLLEASGGITLDNIEEYAKTRVDMISVGSLTSSVRAIDMSLEIV